MSSLHVEVLLLALASSTDNLTVGLSIGVDGHVVLPLWANLFIATCNACGALIASHFGSSLGSKIPSLAPFLAATAFGYLSIQEHNDYRRSRKNGGKRKNNPSVAHNDKTRNKGDESHKKPLAKEKVFALAFPMTLNNLAGGVAGGAAGLSAALAGFYAWMASVVTMAVGYYLGKRLLHGQKQRLWFNPTICSSVLLAALCLLTLADGMTNIQLDQP